MKQPERADDQRVAREPFVDAVAVVARIDAVAVRQVRAPRSERQRYGLPVDMKPELVAQKPARPEIVVAADQVQFQSRVAQFGERAEHLEAIGKDGVAVFKPEVEEVAEADQALEPVRGAAPQERHKRRPLGTRRIGDLQVHIGKEQGFVQSRPNLFSGQMRSTASPMSCLRATGPNRRLSRLLLRWSPRT